jgi:hypothetical protein
MILRVESKYQKLYGFSSLWAKYVEGFDHSKHCEPCLLGTRNRQISKEIPINTDIVIPLKEGQVLYICGVTYPYVWKNNFHLVVKGKDGARAEERTFNGAAFTVKDAERIFFDDGPAKQKYSQLGDKFTTCRNFQFGVYYFEDLGINNKTQLEMF